MKSIDIESLIQRNISAKKLKNDTLRLKGENPPGWSNQF